MATEKTNNSTTSEEIYKTIFSNSPFGIIYFNSVGKIIDCNEKVLEITGVKQEVLFKVNLLKDLKDEKFRFEIKKTLVSGIGFFEGIFNPFLSNNGTPIIANFSAIYSKKNEIKGGIILIEDNSKRVEAERKLKESEQFLREAQRIAHIGHWEKNLKTNDIQRSKELLRIYNIDPVKKEFTNTDFYNLIHPEDRAIVKKTYQIALQNHKNFDLTYRLIFSKDEIKYVYEKVKIFYNEKSEPIRSLGIVQDITKNKKQEILQAALFKISDEANSDKSLSELYGSIHNIIKNLMPADNFYIALYNEETKLLNFPYHVDEKDKKPEPHPLSDGLTEYVLSQKKSMIITEEIDKQLQSEGKVGLSGEYAKIWVGIYLNFESSIEGVLVIQDYHNPDAFSSEDIELLEFVSVQVIKAINKKYADEKLALSEKKLKKLNADKDKFFSIISHDLRSPFQGLMGMSELLTETYNGLSEYEKMESISSLNDSIQNVYSLILELLEWSSIQTGRMKFAPKKTNLKDAFAKVVAISEISAKNKEITINDIINENVIVYADPNMIETIFRNLLANAIKFTPNNGKITISTKKQNNSIIVQIKDNGIGMKKTVLKKLFKIDENYSSLGTKGEKGTGLGLILCKELVEKNGGTIWAESELSKGSSLYFALPE
ncbi:MAG: hypothetical protein COW71_00010 [Ignavibacteriales bacterium CG18_big_fil_WC_8_21_14_2_50_31_20]|nr:MAG: hypothetical protein COW71_00010 [Ignavibacteriales bacterium CG18_big_fil_WC_8_21_14_2_50_31_20]